MRDWKVLLDEVVMVGIDMGVGTSYTIGIKARCWIWVLHSFISFGGFRKLKYIVIKHAVLLLGPSEFMQSIEQFL